MVFDPGESSFGSHLPTPFSGSHRANSGNSPAVSGRDHLTAATVEDVFSGDDNTNATTDESDYVTDGNRIDQNHPRERDFVTEENGPDMIQDTLPDDRSIRPGRFDPVGGKHPG